MGEQQIRQREKALEQMRESMPGAQESAARLDVPAANLELFRRYEDEIRQYSMQGLELAGL